MCSVQLLVVALIALSSAARASDALAVTTDEDVSAVLRRVLPEVSYENVPLQRVLNDLCARLGTNAVVEAQALAEAGVDLQAPTTLIVRQMPAEQVLRLALGEAICDKRLDLVFDEGVLRISTGRSLGWCVTQVYDVRTLLDVAPGQKPLRPDAREDLRQMLVDVITGSIAPDSWEKAGGKGSIHKVGEDLIIYNALAAHRRVAALLQGLVKIQRGGTAWVEPGWEEEDAANQPVWAALRSVVPQVSYRGVTLARFAEDLRRGLGINVHVYTNALAKAGVNADRQIGLNLSNVTVERLLREALSQLGTEDLRLGWEVRHGVLLIGTLSGFGELVARAYEVADLTSSDMLLRQLIDLITSSVEPDTWDKAGGKGALHYFRGRLVVYNAPPIQREIEELLSKLRQRAGEAKAKP